MVSYLSILNILSMLYGFISCGRSEGSNDKIERPCPTNSLECVRSFFANNWDCARVCGCDPDSITIPYIEAMIPDSNILFIAHNYTIQGLKNHEIKNLFMNRATGKFVFEVEFKKLNFSSSQATCRYNLKGREPVDLSDDFYVIHSGISFTLVSNYDRCSDMLKGQVNAYLSVGVGNEPHNFGPGFVNDDPEIRLAHTALMNNRVRSSKEVFVTVAPIVFLRFINATICRFNS